MGAGRRFGYGQHGYPARQQGNKRIHLWLPATAEVSAEAGDQWDGRVASVDGGSQIGLLSRRK